MSRAAKTLERVLAARSDASIRIDELYSLLDALGFEVRIRGSHHSFRRAGIVERINLQADGSHAKPYQVRQVRRILIKYGLGRVPKRSDES